MTNQVRVRYAPSPTGDPHVGNIRTALFNWLYARHSGGVFILRIEDTDQMRTEPGAIESILESLRWLGLDWDEGPGVGGPFPPYVQSERLPLYREAAERLVGEGRAYYCYCTPEELDLMRKEQQRLRQPPRYDRRCRDLTEAARRARESEGKPRVIRFKTPEKGDPILVDDIVRGEVSFDPAVLDDFVLLKSDGYPTYHLANVVDDHMMKVTHVLRAEEWLPSAPRHLLLYQALGYQPPRFGHLPMILGPDRAKLSKRHGATALLEYRKDGYLPDAMCNFLALLGWSLDDKTEIIPKDELVRHFSLERVGRSPAIFNLDKLTWMNGVYLRQLPADDLARRLAEAVESYVRQHQPPIEALPGLDYMRALVPLVQERLKTLNPDEVWGLCSSFLAEPREYRGSLVPQGLDRNTTRAALQATTEAIATVSGFTAEAVEGVMRPLAERLHLRTRDLFSAVRVAVTGGTVSPPLFETMAVLGKKRVLARLRYAVGTLDETVDASER
ncbi:MAG: glutamate--tRNA ligase [Chloroflexi bacterium]|nr:glutamate--tRNA ligase [Chloroflexota bacterium]